MLSRRIPSTLSEFTMNRIFRVISLILASLWLGISLNCAAETIHTHGEKPVSHHHHHEGADDGHSEHAHHGKAGSDTSCEVCPCEVQTPQAFEFTGKHHANVFLPTFTQAFLKVDLSFDQVPSCGDFSKEFRPSKTFKFSLASPNSPPIYL